MTTTNSTYNWQDMMCIISDAQIAIQRVQRTHIRNWQMATTNKDNDYLYAKTEERKWAAREFDRYPHHPAVYAAIQLARPRDWQQLVLEHPHTAQGDKSRLAFTQNEDKGRRDIQAVTSVGKYLFRHFDLPDHTIRDLVARHGSPSAFKFVHTTAEMIYHLHRGPGSCMVWSDSRAVRCSDGVTRHPYEVYDPKYGWHMAVRTEGDDTIGRALCMTNPDSGNKYFVRTYAKPAREGGYSETDNAMENWLQEQGYSKQHYWDNGEKLAYHPTCNEFLAPYLDGNDKRVEVCNGYIEIDDNGEYLCDQTGGCPTDDSGDYFECEDCGDRVAEDDGYWAGQHEDIHLCESCQDNNYRYAYSRRGVQYYIHEDNVVYVESQSEYYDEDYLSDNEIVQLENGEYESMDNAVNVDDDWYDVDDERICRFEDTDEYGLTEDGWQCAQSCNWFTDGIDYVEVNCEKYHPDHAPDQDDAEDTDTPTMLTMDMLSQVALVENYGIELGTVRFSMTILHNGTYMTATRDVTTQHIATFGLDQVRISMRQIISSELMHMDSINAKLRLESTSTI